MLPKQRLMRSKAIQVLLTRTNIHTEQGYTVNALQIAMWSVPIAVVAVVVGTIFNLLFDRNLNRLYGKGEGK